jgi:(S)-citramalyl-CoA lyase
MASEPNQPRRSLLFVPATRLDRYAKALATGADAVCIDLEDAVGDEAKGLARRDALRILATQRPGRPEVWLRINAPQTALSHLDLEALREAGLKPDALVVPKVAGEDTVVQLESELTGVMQGVPLVLMIESAKAMVNIDAIAGASADVTALLFGAIDYSADVGCAVDWEALLYARSRVVLAAAAASVDVLDAPFMRVPSRDALEVESRGAARLGFTGKAAIHPTQIDVIQEAFTPTRDEIAWARRIIAAYEATPSGALLVDGILVDRPVIITARRVLRKASWSKPP